MRHRKLHPEMRVRILQVWRERQRRKAELERLPTDDELATESGVTKAMVRKVMEAEKLRIENESRGVNLDGFRDLMRSFARARRS